VYDKKGREMAFATAVNNTDTIRMVVFSNVWTKNKFNIGDMLLIRGKKDKESLLVNSFSEVQTSDNRNKQVC